MDYGIIVVNIFLIFSLIGVGFIAGKRRLFSERASKDFSSILIEITLPLSIFSSMLREFQMDLLVNSALLFGLGFVFLAIIGSLGFLFMKILKIKRENQGVWMFNCMFTNAAFVGLPVANAIWGPDGMFLASILNLSLTILNFSLGVSLIKIGREALNNGELTYEADIHKDKNVSRKGKKKFPWRKVFSNVNIAIILGLICFICGINLPTPVRGIVDYLAGITTPLSMVVIGLNLAKENFKQLVTDRDALLLTFWRLIAAPLLIFGLATLLPLSNYPMVPPVLLVLFCMPAPSLCLILSEQHGGNCSFASKSIFQTTLLSIATIPLLLLLIV